MEVTSATEQLVQKDNQQGKEGVVSGRSVYARAAGQYDELKHLYAEYMYYKFNGVYKNNSKRCELMKVEEIVAVVLDS